MKKVTYLENNGFIVTTDDVIMVFDDLRDPAHALHHTLDANPEKPVVFFVSHHHHNEHLNKSIFELAQNHQRTYVMANQYFPQNVPDSLQVAGMSHGDVIEDLPGGLKVKAYESAGCGVSFLVTTKDGEKIYHAGEMVIDPKYDGKADHKGKKPVSVDLIIQRVATENPTIDIAFFPVDPETGENCTKDAASFLSAIDVKDFFPMHIHGDIKKACDFASYAPVRTKCHCEHTPGKSVEL